jgi:hypothetical protein
MAILTKNRARKNLAEGIVNVGYGNYELIGLATKEHITLRVGDYQLKVELERAERLAGEILMYVKEYKR